MVQIGLVGTIGWVAGGILGFESMLWPRHPERDRLPFAYLESTNLLLGRIVPVISGSIAAYSTFALFGAQMPLTKSMTLTYPAKGIIISGIDVLIMSVLCFGIIAMLKMYQIDLTSKIFSQELEGGRA